MQVLPAIFECPKCSTRISAYAYISGNTIGAVRYSDTYLKAPMGIPPWANYAGCSDCGFVFKKDEHKVKTVSPAEIKDIKDFKAGLGPFDIFKGLLGGAREEKIKEDRKKFLLWYLWGFNHLIDQKRKKKEVEEGDYKKYTDELLKCVEEELDNPEKRLLKAEILREKGEFEKARQVLEFSFPTALESIVKQEKIRIACKQRSVFSLQRSRLSLN